MRRVVFALASAMAVAVPLHAQQAPPAPGAASANPISDGIRHEWNSVERYLRDSAAQMPEENYTFKPTPDVRSFGAILAHVAGVNFAYCGAGKGEQGPFGEASFEGKITSKADITKAVNDSIAYCDQVYGSLIDANLALTGPNPFGKAPMSRTAALVGNIGHVNEHYGNLVTYFRLKGMVPPSSK